MIDVVVSLYRLVLRRFPGERGCCTVQTCDVNHGVAHADVHKYLGEHITMRVWTMSWALHRHGTRGRINDSSNAKRSMHSL